MQNLLQEDCYNLIIQYVLSFIGHPECRQCSHDCNVTSNGVQCVCPEGMGFDSTGRKCIGKFAILVHMYTHKSCVYAHIQ